MKEYQVNVYYNGTKEWYLNGQLHREDGPAVEWRDGSKEWWLDGQLHREDGPAYEGADGTKEWYLNGRLLSEKEFKQIIQHRKEMTIAQIEQELGYKIKIAKG